MTDDTISTGRLALSAVAPVPVLQTGPTGIARDIYSLVGGEGVFTALGPTVATVLLFGAVFLLGSIGVLVSARGDDNTDSTVGLPTTDGGIDTGRVKQRLQSDSSDESAVEAVEGAEEGVVEEATRRLQMRNEEVTGEALKNEIEAVKADAEGEAGSGRVGAIRSPTERSRTERVAIAPNDLTEKESYLRVESQGGNEYFVREVTMSDFPSRVTPGWLSRLFMNTLSVSGARVVPKMRIVPRDPDTMMRQLNVRMTRVKSQIRRKRKQNKVNTTKEEQQRDEIEGLRSRLESGEAKLFDFALYMEVIAEDKDTLDEATDELRQILSKVQATMTPLHDRQRDAMSAVAPVGKDPIRNTQLMDQRSLASTFPFIEPSLVMPGGVLIGTHLVTDTPIIIDRFALSGHNTLISGKIGSGKSYLAKLMMWRRMMIDADTEVLMIDPVGGFSDLTDAFGEKGQRVVIGGDTIINPLEIKAASDSYDTSGTHNPYDAKIRSVMGIIRSHFSEMGGLDASKEGVIRRALRMAYLEQGIVRDPATHHKESPIFEDVLDILRNLRDGNRPEDFLDVPRGFERHLDPLTAGEEDDGARSESSTRGRIAEIAHEVLLGMEAFRKEGQLSMLNGQSNVELDAQCVQFDLDNVADPNDAHVYMHIVLDWLFQRAKASDKQTLVTIDEAHYMLDNEEATQMLNLFARHSRHFHSGMTLISQTVAEFIEDETAKKIYDQCDVRALMKHKDLGKDVVETLNLNERDRQFILDAQAGENHEFATGLIHVSDHGKLRSRIKANPFEHHIIDSDLNVWAYLVGNGQMTLDDVPESERRVAKQILQQKQNESASP